MCWSLRTGAFAGTPVATGSKHAVVAKSPLTGMIGDSLSGSFWSHTLRRAGYDALIVTGRADALVYLSIHDDQVQIRPAHHLAGQTTFATEASLRDELGSDEVRISSIGPGRRADGAFCLRRQRRGAHGRSHGHGRGDGVQEPEGHRRARHRHDPRGRHRCAVAHDGGSGAALPGAA